MRTQTASGRQCPTIALTSVFIRSQLRNLIRFKICNLAPIKHGKRGFPESTGRIQPYDDPAREIYTVITAIARPHAVEVDGDGQGF